MPKEYCVYILAAKYRGATYIGVTNNISARMYEHQKGTGSKCAHRFGIKRLVYSDFFQDVRDAIEAEKRLKKWRREWKWALIEEANSNWDDLSEHTLW